MFRFRLPTGSQQVELIANGVGAKLSFQVLGPSTEVAFVEELIQQHFGSLNVAPKELFQFLQQDPWVKEAFLTPELLSGDLVSSSVNELPVTFQKQPLGAKLVEAGILKPSELDQLLIDYQPFAKQQRFGEFLRLNFKVSAEVMEFLLNPLGYQNAGFNQKRLGERLRDLGLIDDVALEKALERQRESGGLLGQILARQGDLSPVAARFFSNVQLDDEGGIDYETISNQDAGVQR